MRRISGTFFPSLAVGGGAVSTRSMREAKGVTEMRILTPLWPRAPDEAMVHYKSKLNEHAHPSPKTRAEAMAHLTRRPSYEYIPEFQRWANDLMAIYGIPLEYQQEVSYHYHRLWKVFLPGNFTAMDGNGSIEVVRLKPAL
jgi:hypothetical protein